MTIIPTNKIFHFIRGAILGAFGQEDLRQHRILIVGMGSVGQELLTMLCADNVKLYFLDDSLVNYDRAHQACPQIRSFKDQQIDIIINLDEGFIKLKDKSFPISNIQVEDSYNQGIHEFYL